jgi:hypothetical protein
VARIVIAAKTMSAFCFVTSLRNSLQTVILRVPAICEFRPTVFNLRK